MSKNSYKIFSYTKKTRFERMIKTFIEVFLSYIAVNIGNVDLTNKIALKGLIASAIGSAISVILNLKCGD